MPLALELAPRASLGPIGRLILGVDVPCPGQEGTLTVGIDEKLVDPFNIPADDVLLTEWRGKRFRAESTHGIGFEDGSSGEVHETLAGRVRGATVRGTLALTIDQRDAGGNPAGTCATGRLRWSARSAPGRIYAGTTGEGDAVVIRLDRTRRRVTRADIGQWQACREGGGFLAHNFFFGPLHAGRFSSGSPYKLDGGRGRDAFRARFGRLRASGTFRDRRTWPDAHCDSGLIRWHARTSLR
jgi:hypothetical protein